MGARGQLKLPPNLKIVAPERKTEATAAESTSPGRPTKPDDLPNRAVPLWDELVEALDHAGLLARVDGPALELALRHYVVAVASSDELLSGDELPVHGRWVSQRFRDHSMAFAEYMRQMGLSFAARARVPAGTETPGGAENPFTRAG